MDKIALLCAGVLDVSLTLGYLLSGQWYKALYWFGATLIAVAVALGR
jgi:hypothetical protein